MTELNLTVRGWISNSLREAQGPGDPGTDQMMTWLSGVGKQAGCNMLGKTQGSTQRGFPHPHPGAVHGAEQHPDAFLALTTVLTPSLRFSPWPQHFLPIWHCLRASWHSHFLGPILGTSLNFFLNECFGLFLY